MMENEEQQNEAISQETPELSPEHQEMIDKAAELGIGADGQPLPEKTEETQTEEVAEDQAQEVEPEEKPDPMAELKKELEFTKRQMASIQSLLAKSQTTASPQKQDAPGLLDQLPENERLNTVKLVQEIVDKQYGDKFRKAEEAASAIERDSSMRQSMASMESHLGQDFQKVEPVLVDMMQDLTKRLKDAPDGSPEFEEAAREMTLATYFPKAYADQARLRYQMQLAQKSQQAKAQQVQKNFQKTTAVGGAGQVVGQSLADKIKNNSATLEELESAWKRTAYNE